MANNRVLRRRDAVGAIDAKLLPRPELSTQLPKTSVTPIITIESWTTSPEESKNEEITGNNASIQTNFEPRDGSNFSTVHTGIGGNSLNQGNGMNLAATSSNLNVPSTSYSSLLPSSRPTGGASGFGSTGGSLFSTAKPATGGLFGSTTANQQQQQQQGINTQQQVIQTYHPFVRACGNPQLTGTENDKHIANLNQVAAALGVGKAPYKDGNQVLTYNMEGNFFEKFVGIGYNKISEHTDDEGIVTLVLNHQTSDLNSEEKKAKILEIISNILGNQQNVKVLYAPNTSLRSLPDGSTEISIIVKEGGFVVGACKLSQVLNDGSKVAQLEAQLKVDKTRIVPKVGMSKAQKERYLETVPDGIDERLWRQAIAENPAPNKMLPVSVRGWESLRDRQKAQMVETKIYQDALASLENRVEKVESDHSRAQVEMESIRCRHKQLSYRLLRILLAQWISQRYSKQVDTDEDQIEARCDTLLAKLNRHHQLQSWIANFYELLEKNSEKLKEGAEKAYDMSMDDQKYARAFLTEILYVGERLTETNQLQYEDLQLIKRTLDGE